MKKHQTRWLLAVLSQAALAVSISHAQTGAPFLPETVITASRIPQDPSLLPQGVTVISGKDIEAAGLTHANEAARWLGGVVGRIDTSGGRDQTLDLRGFGETAGSNLVVLVDGVRQNEGDMSGASLAWIPVSSIERIEIVRGSNAVLYGDGATAGTINVITNQGHSGPGGSLSLGVGTLGTRESQVALSTKSGDWRFQINGSARDTDNHRDNYGNRERSGLGRATWTDSGSQFSVQLGASSSKSRLPGELSEAEYLANPRQTRKPDDRGDTESTKFLVSAEVPLAAWRLAADLSVRAVHSSLNVPSQPSNLTTKTDATRLGSRVWREFGQGPVSQTLLLGLDAEQWDQATSGVLYEGTPFSVIADSDRRQTSQSIYGRHEVSLKPAGLKVFAGARRTVAERASVGNPPGQFEAGNTSWDLGGALKVGQSSEVFGKVGSSFRLPNADEYSCYVEFCMGVVSKLQPQLSKDLELGWRQTLDGGQWTVRYYKNNLRQEIGYDPMIGNVNFDPTRREGIELDVSAKLAARLDGVIQFAERRAVFRSGAYVGNTVPLVPSKTLTARVTFKQSATQQWLLSSQLVSSQRIGSDFASTSDAKIPGYGTLNLRYSQTVDAWTFAIAGHNLLDKGYYNYRPYPDSIYPEAGRTFLVSAQRRF